MLNRHDCETLDTLDPLADRRNLFDLPEGVNYLDGNSLGALPCAVPARVEDFMRREWGQDLIRSWNDNNWFDAPQRVGAKLSPLIGADPHEVIVCDNLSTNIFKILSGATAMRPNRKVILTESGNFPTDHYMADAVASQGKLSVKVVDAKDIIANIDETVAVVSVSHVDYRTGAVLDMTRITQAAHDAGALIMWDLAHSAGALPVRVNLVGADFAVGCGYKYLNGGPGAPAFMFAADRHHEALLQPLTGWHGHEAPFELARTYRPAPGLVRLRTGTPAMLSMVAFDAALDAFDGVDLLQLRAKSVRLGELFAELVQALLPDQFVLVGPADSRNRGSQISYEHEHAYPIMQALIARGVIGDFRAPNRMRFGFAPLYVRYVDVWDAVDHLADLVATREWDNPAFRARSAVT